MLPLNKNPLSSVLSRANHNLSDLFKDAYGCYYVYYIFLSPLLIFFFFFTFWIFFFFCHWRYWWLTAWALLIQIDVNCSPTPPPTVIMKKLFTDVNMVKMKLSKQTLHCVDNDEFLCMSACSVCWRHSHWVNCGTAKVECLRCVLLCLLCALFDFVKAN